MTSETKRILYQVFLFLTTFVTTTLAGSELSFGRSVFTSPDYSWNDFASGMEFSIPLLLILGVHEFGHYFTALAHRVKTSLPYFIPIPPLPFLAFNIGTLGAIIRLRSKPASNLQHFDIGISGPLAGFIMAVVILFYGFLTLPPAEYIFEIHPEYKEYGLEYRQYVYEPEFFQKIFEKFPAENKEEVRSFPVVWLGTNLVFEFFGNFIADPDRVPDPHELMHFPILLAGFLALFVTSLNLLPIGQLDGGHVIYGLFGHKKHKVIASCFLVLLLFYAGLGNEYINPKLPNNDLLIAIPIHVILLYLALTGLKLSKRDTAMYALLMFAVQFGIMNFFPAVKGYVGWGFFALIVGRFLGVYHPQSEIEEPLDTTRVVLGWITLIVFVVCFSPAPIEAQIIMEQR